MPGGAPHLGINALNAAQIGLAAVNANRKPSRTKTTFGSIPIITKGGDLVNVVPADVRIETYVRGSSVSAILDASAKVNRAFKAGADAVGAQCEITEIPGYMPVEPDKNLQQLLYENYCALLGEENVLFDHGMMGGSTDLGDLSALMPVIQGRTTGAAGISHNSNYSIADKEMSYIVSSKALAMTVVDLLCDGAREALRVKEEFRPIMTKEQYLREWGQLQ